MIDRPLRVFLSVLVSLTVLSSASGPSAHPAAEEVSAAPAEAQEATGPLHLLRASYEVDVLGPVAVGRLVREFVSDTEVDVTATSVGAISGLAVERLEVETGGGSQELRTPADDPRNTRNSTSARSERQRPRPAEGRARLPETVRVETGQTASVRTTFRMNLPLRDGRFLVQLPAVGAEPLEEEAAAATTLGPPGTITLIVHHDEPLLHAASPTHDVITAYEGDRTVVTLAEGESESRDFEFEFALGVEDDPTLVGRVSPTEDGAHDVIVVLAPPMKPVAESVRPKQVLFVLDTSGSMSRGKLELARAALAACLEMLRETDLLNVVAFSDKLAMMAEEPVGADAPALQNAGAWLGALRPGGGTHLFPALEAVFGQPESAEHHRMIVVLTDGAVQDRQPVMERLERGLGEARLFVIGIGEDVTRDAVLRLAELGRGMAVFADDPEGLETIVAAMFASVADPLAWDLSLDWGGAEVESMEPARLPDLYAGRPVTVRARVRGELPRELGLEASTTDGLRRFTTILADAADERFAKPGR